MSPTQTETVTMIKKIESVNNTITVEKPFNPFALFVNTLMSDKIERLIVKKTQLTKDQATQYYLEIDREKSLFIEQSAMSKNVWRCLFDENTIYLNDREMNKSAMIELSIKLKSVIKDISFGRAEVTLLEEK